MQSKTIQERLEALRAWMRREQLDAFIFPSTDPHNSEYVPDHWKGREWISGFNGSAGTAVVTAEKAALWTDSRYFIAAEQQLEGTGYELMRERIDGTPTIAEWLGKVFKEMKSKGAFSDDVPTVGMDGFVSSHEKVMAMQSDLLVWGVQLETGLDPLAEIWTDRPSIPKNRVNIHPVEYAGESAAGKIGRIREKLMAQHAQAILVNTLDDIAWTLNLRGSDVHCNPVFVAYLLITQEEAVLFINPDKVDGEVRASLLAEGVEVEDYDRVPARLEKYANGVLSIDPALVNHTLFEAVKCIFKPQKSVIPAMKAVKNEVEIAGYRSAMRKDGVAMVKFLCWLQKAVERGGETELSIDRKLTSLRAEQPLFKGLSFDTIAGYGAHGAIVHYEATEATDVVLRPEGLLLLDSGGQYLDGTTDITRTIPLGPVTDEMRHIYTLVLKGHIRLQMLKFPDGACGSQLDAAARAPLWREGLNFLHGTGHGVGAYLNVHEGPHQIRMEWWPAPLRAGMTVTDEPGIYVEGKFGVRIENTLLITPYMETAFGRFLQFEPLTLCPIDMAPVDLSLLDNEERGWLDDYHRKVYAELSPLLDEEERLWLANATKPVG
ncbi:MAG: aminopeptidase P family protein [Prevotella sp.]|nr:aminopeptidase P family protein [Prevotella sp.]